MREEVLTMFSFQQQLLAPAVTTAAPTATLTPVGLAPTRPATALRLAVSLNLFYITTIQLAHSKIVY